MTARHSTSQHATVLNGSDLLSPSTRTPLDMHRSRRAAVSEGREIRVKVTRDQVARLKAAGSTAGVPPAPPASNCGPGETAKCMRQ